MPVSRKTRTVPLPASVAESARVSETVLKLAGEVAEPINSRYTVAAERVKTLAA